MINFTDEAWEDYLSWQQEDRKILKRINRLIEEIKRQPFEGIGKPEPLKYQYAGAWSRRITDEHRLIYMVKEDEIYFLSFRDHYK
ncbi:addiction module toxin, Txe/YoeB family [Streptococcus sp. oral taxon 056 str. F0418]|uniref:Txe/YoeB family addiction module toxin n=1 Tax=Streptococcus sp. oral taxon 056 TaxID=712620 RepID=UPI00021806EE|nr:Txe/YoeB family addiction module toxin [Streptococcus sp. oral taxon 056]EGP66214.1 addiction module toxin, Txe/YoeB family [Streptococcus sp. oral taxon 056 str. F0418]